MEMTEFDYQWKNFPSKDTEYNDNRIQNFYHLLNYSLEKGITRMIEYTHKNSRKE